MADEIFGLSAEGIRRTAKANELTLGRLPAVGAPHRRRVTHPEGLPTVSGRLTSNITAASPDSLTGASTFTFRQWTKVVGDAHDPKYYEEATDDTVGVNRSQMSGSAGQFVVCMQINNEWMPIWVDCGA